MDETGRSRKPATRGPRPRLDAAEVIRVAAGWMQDCRRLDMQALAAELGVTRMTLHRYIGGRERLVGETLWHQAERAWAQCAAAVDARRTPGDRELRSVRVMHAFNTRLLQSGPLRTLFDNEPELSLRVITDPEGPIQPRTVAVIDDLIAADEAAGRLRPIIDRTHLAYALVRLAEAFLFNNLVTGRPVPVEETNELQAALLGAGRLDQPLPDAGRGDRRVQE